MGTLNRTGIISLAAILVLLLNTLLPFYALYQIPAQTTKAEQSTALFGDKVLLCTADGFKLVSWDDLEKQPPASQHPQYQCAMCYVVAHGTALQPPVSDVLELATLAEHSANFPAQDADITGHAFRQAHHTRAPPQNAQT